MSFEITGTEIGDVNIVTGRRIGDARGFLERLFCRDALSSVMGGRQIVQINRTVTQGAGTVRGLHFQHQPFAEMKIVRCLSGRIFDVALDLRRGSATLGRWHGEALSGDEPKALVIPEGVAHGFQLLSDECELLYLHTACYAPAAEDGVNAADPTAAIAWPLEIGFRSERDRGLRDLSAEFTGIEL